jgi:hypothetical protein
VRSASSRRSSQLAALAIVLEMAVLYLVISGLSFLRDDPDPR